MVVRARQALKLHNVSFYVAFSLPASILVVGAGAFNPHCAIFFSYSSFSVGPFSGGKKWRHLIFSPSLLASSIMQAGAVAGQAAGRKHGAGREVMWGGTAAEWRRNVSGGDVKQAEGSSAGGDGLKMGYSKAAASNMLREAANFHRVTALPRWRESHANQQRLSVNNSSAKLAHLSQHHGLLRHTTCAPLTPRWRAAHLWVISSAYAMQCIVSLDAWL